MTNWYVNWVRIKWISIFICLISSSTTLAEQPYVVSNSGFSQGQFQSCAPQGQYACFRVFAGRYGDNYIGGTCAIHNASSTYNLGDVQVAYAIVRELAADDHADFWFNGRQFQVAGGTGARPCELGRTTYSYPNTNIGAVPNQFTISARILVSGMGEAWGTMDIYYIPYFEDFGDAPDPSNGTGLNNYRTRRSDNGPSHRAIRNSFNVYLGESIPDDDGNGLQNATATADDLNAGSSFYGIAADDENGVILPSMKFSDPDYTATANVTNTSGSNAYLYAWIDFDNSGTFDVDEMITNGTGTGGAIVINSGLSNSSQPLFWSSLADLTANGYYFSRIRISSSLLTTTATGSNEDGRSRGTINAAGEVEDYQICVGCVDILGHIYEDINGDSLLSDSVGLSGIPVYLYTDDGDGIPNAADGAPTYTTTTDANGYYYFLQIPGVTYFVSPNAPSSGSILSEQTYTRTLNDTVNNTYVAGFCDANGDGVADLNPTAVTGSCFGGWDGDQATNNSNANLALREHISRIEFSADSASVTAVDFAFSYNVVTNTNNNGQGSLSQFITNANGISGANNMRFVPSVVANDSDPSSDWWVVSPATTLVTITGANGASTTIDGTAYSFSDGITVRDTNAGNVMTAQTVGSSNGCTAESMPAIEKPELQIDMPVTASPYAAELLIINADNTTVRNISFTGGSLGINIYSAGITDTLIENNILGIDPAGNDDLIGVDTCGASMGCAGIAIAHPSNSSLNGDTGIIRNNVIKTAHNNITLNNLNGQNISLYWKIIHNHLLGTVSSSATAYNNLSIRYGVPRYLQVTGNILRSATGDAIYQRNTSNVALFQQVTSNDIQTAEINGIHIQSGNSSQIECNLIHDNGDSGVSIDGNTNVDGYLITKNSFENNESNAVDLHNGATGEGVSLNSTLCNNDTGTGANNNLARPQINRAFLDGTILRLFGDYCATGDFTFEVYSASSGNGDLGSDGLNAGEGVLYLNSVTAVSGTDFDRTLTVTGLTEGDFITALAQRTTTGGLGLLQDSSEFSANVEIEINNKDWGDAPESLGYNTLYSSNGPRHTVTSDPIYLGNIAPDVEFDGFGNGIDNNGNATDDESTNIADEDGVNGPAYLNVTNAKVTLNVVCNDHNGTTDLGGIVYAWMDFNSDGDFVDNGEFAKAGCDDMDNLSDGNTTILFSGVQNPASINTNIYTRLRITNQNLTSNDFNGVISNGEIEDHYIKVELLFRLSGFVFEDNGLGAAIAHDGILDNSESGLGNKTVRVIYNGSGIGNYVTGDIITSTTTSGDGSYTITIPVELAGEDLILDVLKEAAWIDSSEANVTAMPQVNNVSVTDSQMKINAAAGDDLVGLNFGKVREPVMEPDNFSYIEPGKGVLLQHKFKSYTQGIIAVSTINVNEEPNTNSWSKVIYRDNNCNGKIETNERQITNNITVSEQQEICLLSKIFANIDVPNNALYKYDLIVNMVLDDHIGTGHNITRQLIDTDTINTSFLKAGELKLTKTVKNITQNTAVAVSNEAQPGDTLEYKIKFENITTGTINDIKITDSIPEYTLLSQPITCADGNIPNGLSCSVITNNGSNLAGFKGDFYWAISDGLRPGMSGEVVYFVEIE